MSLRTFGRALFLVAACSACGGPRVASTVPSPTAIAAPATMSPSPASPLPSATATRSAPPTSHPRVVVATNYSPFASAGGITLVHPSDRVERVGFHQSNHEGAQELTVLPSAVRPATLESRDRLTAARTAGDVVSDPNLEIRAPVTGRVKRAGRYVLYCKYSDDYAVFEPDAHPGWEVKILHIDGVRVKAGDRVVAGQTVIAPRPTKLPFESQVDEITAKPHWPHVHIEVVDPSIPNRPSPGSGC